MKMLLVELLEGWKDADEAIESANKIMRFYIKIVLNKFLETKQIKLEYRLGFGDLHVSFKKNDEDEKIKTGSYNLERKEIIIYIFPDDEETIINSIITKNTDVNRIMRKVKSITSTLAHEIQHHLDNVKSNGNFVNNKQTFNYVINPKDRAYYRLPHEIWARMTEAIYKVNVLYIMNVRDYIERFKEEFVAWTFISENDKKKLIKNVYKYYTEVYKPSLINKSS